MHARRAGLVVAQRGDALGALGVPLTVEIERVHYSPLRGYGDGADVISS